MSFYDGNVRAVSAFSLSIFISMFIGAILFFAYNGAKRSYSMVSMVFLPFFVFFLATEIWIDFRFGTSYPYSDKNLPRVLNFS